MKVRIKQISDKADECLIIECVEVTPILRAYGRMLSPKVQH